MRRSDGAEPAVPPQQGGAVERQHRGGGAEEAHWVEQALQVHWYVVCVCVCYIDVFGWCGVGIVGVVVWRMRPDSALCLVHLYTYLIDGLLALL